jgi:hypothetical protein
VFTTSKRESCSGIRAGHRFRLPLNRAPVRRRPSNSLSSPRHAANLSRQCTRQPRVLRTEYSPRYLQSFKSRILDLLASPPRPSKSALVGTHRRLPRAQNARLPVYVIVVPILCAHAALHTHAAQRTCLPPCPSRIAPDARRAPPLARFCFGCSCYVLAQLFIPRHTPS